MLTGRAGYGRHGRDGRDEPNDGKYFPFQVLRRRLTCAGRDDEPHDDGHGRRLREQTPTFPCQIGTQAEQQGMMGGGVGGGMYGVSPYTMMSPYYGALMPRSPWYT